METITWHFPLPLGEQRLRLKEEQQLLYDLAEQFSTIINHEVKVNNGYGIDFNDDETTVNYSGRGLLLYTKLIEKPYFEERDKRIRIDYLCISPVNQGTGTRLIKHFIQQLKYTSYQKVILIALDNDAQRFWRKNGFKPKYEDSTDWSLALLK